ncbi:MAG TPA: DUF1573 domain-containing protein [Panacibacter sp.]|nr:DUF1573 domain-containing protein [Panacibacter sp.]
MNKTILSSAILLILFSACSSNTSNVAAQSESVGKDSANFTSVLWIDSIVNFGTVTKGQKVHITYKCKNVGNKPLFIYSVRPGCGCTVADYTKAAIAPGGTGEVNAEFDSNHGVPGEVRKSITVQTNTVNPSPLLIFTGTVTQPETSADSSKKK